MIDYLVQTGLSNAGFSLVLALVALIVGAVTRRPHLAYALWLLVFIKLLTPPVYTIPAELLPWHTPAAVVELALESAPAGVDYSTELTGRMAEALPVAASPGPWRAFWAAFVPWALWIWLAGTLAAMAWSLNGIIRFNRLLQREARPAPEELQAAAAEAARRLKLSPVPTVYTVGARISPLVWWSPGRVFVAVPEVLLEQLESRQLYWILAHELAHVRRRDYLVRWLEWLAGVVFWWNPVVWWAKRNLRAVEEICCDSLVMHSLTPRPRIYANSLLAVVEFLAYPALHTPVMASEIISGGFFLRRCKMIVSGKPSRPNPRWVTALVILLALLVIPLGAQLYAKEKPAKEPAKQATAGTTGETEQAYGGTTGEEGKPSAGTMVPDELIELEHEVQLLVEAGEMSKSEADARVHYLETLLKYQATKEDYVKTRRKSVKVQLDALLESGKITEEEAAEKYTSVEQKVTQQFAELDTVEAEVRLEWERLQALAANGMITYRDASGELDGLLEKAGFPNGLPDEALTYLKEIRVKYAEAVKSGKLSNAEAFDMLLADEIAVQAKAYQVVARDYKLKAIEMTFQEMVERGEITQEEADAKLAKIKAEMGMADGEGPKLVSESGEKPSAGTKQKEK